MEDRGFQASRFAKITLRQVLLWRFIYSSAGKKKMPLTLPFSTGMFLFLHTNCISTNASVPLFFLDDL